MVILGLDPGTATTGYGIIKKDKDGLSCISFGCIKTSPQLKAGARLSHIRTELIGIVKKAKPELAAMEQLFFTTNAKTAISVAQARGVVLETLISFGLPAVEFTPLQIKQAVTSYGKADKIQVQRMVKLLLGLKQIPKPDDAADALATAICCANTNTFN